MKAAQYTLCAGVAALTFAATARAEPPCDPNGGPWVFASVIDPPRGVDMTDVLDQLGLELGARNLALCSRAPSGHGFAPSAVATATATVTFGGHAGSEAEPAPRGSIRIEVEVRRDGRKKGASRVVELAKVPRDRGATVVALAADELLRAASDDLALAAPPAPEPAPSAAELPPSNPEPPSSVAPAIDAPPHADAVVRPASTGWRTLAIGVRGAGEIWSGGLLTYGGDGLVSMRVAPRLRVELAAGARSAFARDGMDGRVEAEAFDWRLGGAWSIARGAHVELAFGARVGVWAVRFGGSPNEGARGGALMSPALTLEAGPSLTLPFGESSALVLDATLAGAPIGVAARDGERLVTGLTGAAVTSSLALVTGVVP